MLFVQVFALVRLAVSAWVSRVHGAKQDELYDQVPGVAAYTSGIERSPAWPLCRRAGATHTINRWRTSTTSSSVLRASQGAASHWVGMQLSTADGPYKHTRTRVMQGVDPLLAWELCPSNSQPSLSTALGYLRARLWAVPAVRSLRVMHTCRSSKSTVSRVGRERSGAGHP
jgi:hypothetical protein